MADSTRMAAGTPTPTPAPRTGGLQHDDRPEGRRRLVLAVTLAAVSALVGAWIYVLFIYDPGLLIDELADRRFPTEAEQICAGYRAQIAQLPPADVARSAAERAEDVAASNVLLSSMIDDLEPIAPTSPPDVRDGVREWLGDWRTYIGNRQDYADALRVDPEARFLEDPKGGPSKGITRAIDSFAQVNRMDSCTTLGDVS